MTNEEFVALIQAGDRERLMELWAQTRRIALKRANRWAAYRSGGAELEDLEQAGFIALIRAVDSFDPAAGCRFSTWYHRFMLGEFGRATGRTTEKQENEPLNRAVSLDAPPSGESDVLTMGEAVPDKRAEAAFLEVEHRDDMRRLHALLMDAVNDLPPIQRASILGRYWGGPQPPYQAQNLQLALRKLRHPDVSRKLRDFL